MLVFSSFVINLDVPQKNLKTVVIRGFPPEKGGKKQLELKA